MRSAICDIAYGEQQADARQHVLRLTTQRRTEHLLQAASADDMLKWIEELQRAARVDVDDAKVGDSTGAVGMAGDDGWRGMRFAATTN